MIHPPRTYQRPLIVLASLVLIAGCQDVEYRVQRRIEMIPSAPEMLSIAKTVAKEGRKPIERRYLDDGPTAKAVKAKDGSDSAPDDAFAMEEHAIALARTRQELQASRDEVRTLNQKVTELTGELASAKTALAEAGKARDAAEKTLAEAKARLESWQKDILGFRDEMRLAEKEEIEAMTEMARLLHKLIQIQEARKVQPAGGPAGEPLAELAKPQAAKGVR